MNPVIYIPNDNDLTSATISNSLKESILASISSGALCPSSVSPEGTSLILPTAETLSISVVLIDLGTSTVSSSVTSSYRKYILFYKIFNIKML